MWHMCFSLLRSDYNICSTVIVLNNLIQYSHCDVVQFFRLKVFTTVISNSNMLFIGLDFPKKVDCLYFLK